MSRATTSGRQVAGAPAGDEAAARAVGQAGQIGQDPEGLVLGRHRPGRLEPAGALQR